MSLADELWEKYGDGMRHSKKEFTAAITEAMQAVRKRDAELCGEVEARGSVCDDEKVLSALHESEALACAAAIEREPLP